MTNWTATSKGVIARVHASLPADATPKDRRRALREAYPFAERSGWAYKAWLRAQKKYLRDYPDLDQLERSPLFMAAKPKRRTRIARLRYVGMRQDADGRFAIFKCSRCTGEARIAHENLGPALHRGPACTNCNVEAA